MPAALGDPIRNVAPMKPMASAAQQEPEVVEPKASNDERLEGLINGQNKDILRAQILAEFATDPDFSKIMAARQRGQQVRVLQGDEVPETIKQPVEKEEEVVDLENMNNAQLMHHMVKKITDRLPELVASSIKPLHDELQSVKGSTMSMEQERVMNQIAATQKKYPDFNQYRAEMAQIANTYRGLNADQVYLLAKQATGKLKLADDQPTQVERPTNNVTKPSPSKRTDATLVRHGRKGFDDALERALGGLEFSTDGE